MTQIEHENAIMRIEGYILNVSKLDEKSFVEAKNELIANMQRDLTCIRMIPYNEFKIYSRMGKHAK